LWVRIKKVDPIKRERAGGDEARPNETETCHEVDCAMTCWVGWAKRAKGWGFWAGRGGRGREAGVEK